MVDRDHRADAERRLVTRAVTFEREGDQLVPVAVCPRRLTLVSVAKCQRCEHFADLCVNPTSGTPFLRCSFRDVPFLEPVGGGRNSGPRVGDLMTTPRSVELDTGLQDALRALLSDSDVVAVLGEDRKPAGLLRRIDVQRRLQEPGGEALLVRDVETTAMLTVSDDAPAAQVAALMAYERISTVGVVGEGGELIGMVCALDIARWVACRSGYLVPSER